jgi:hypothetical protein
MRPPQTVACASVIAFALQTTMLAQTSGPSLGNGNLGSIARSLREKKSVAAPNAPALQDTAPTPTQVAQSPARPVTPELVFRFKVERLLSEEKFDELERTAGEARSSKARFAGGVWQLYIFYESLSKPMGGAKRPEPEWQEHFTHLKHWTAKMPRSVTAHIAFAEADLTYAWVARGPSFADTVKDEDWRVFAERLEPVSEELKLATASPQKCPHLYELMLELALAQGWDKKTTAEAFEKAIAFEPTYIHYYRQYANYLQSKWYGALGEAEAFAELSAERVGGEQGLFIYFEIASLLNCGCEFEEPTTHMSWDRIKQGYVAMEELYGASALKRNRMAYMSMQQGDKAQAQALFAQIGNEWEQRVWWNRANFEAARDAALAP